MNDDFICDMSTKVLIRQIIKKIFLFLKFTLCEIYIYLLRLVIGQSSQFYRAPHLTLRLDTPTQAGWRSSPPLIVESLSQAADIPPA